MVEVDAADLGVDGVDRVHLKLEFTQHGGSFKARGALHALLTSGHADRGVVAASGGNHGVAVAWAARTLGVTAHIFVPEIAAPAKVAALAALGAQVHQEGRDYSEALAAAGRFDPAGDLATVHAYDQVEVIAGAGTLAREIDDQVGLPDTVVLATGGGGLAGGAACWWGSAVRVVAVETEGTPTFAAALAAGEPVDIEVSGIGADALGARRIGALAWTSMRAAGATSAVVSDQDVVEAQRVLWERCRLLVEPAGATGLAALRRGVVPSLGGQRVVVVLCGANTGAVPGP